MRGMSTNRHCPQNLYHPIHLTPPPKSTSHNTHSHHVSSRLPADCLHKFKSSHEWQTFTRKIGNCHRRLSRYVTARCLKPVEQNLTRSLRNWCRNLPQPRRKRSLSRHRLHLRLLLLHNRQTRLLPRKLPWHQHPLRPSRHGPPQRSRPPNNYRQKPLLSSPQRQIPNRHHHQQRRRRQRHAPRRNHTRRIHPPIRRQRPRSYPPHASRPPLPPPRPLRPHRQSLFRILKSRLRRPNYIRRHQSSFRSHDTNMGAGTRGTCNC